jgi:hypothetical protein
LSQRPLDTIAALDYDLGSMLEPGGKTAETRLLAALAASLRTRTLDMAIIAPQSRAIIALLYAEELATLPAITRLRFSRLRPSADGALLARIKLQAERISSIGFVLMEQSDTKQWLISHLDLDLAVLRSTSPAAAQTGIEQWDPYKNLSRILD